MKDLTEGSVVRHLLGMAAFMAVSMLVQTLYLLADLYWVGRLGKEAIAAVGVAGNLTMIVLALTQMLSVGTTTLVSHAAGAKDQPRAELVFNQSFVMSILAMIALCALGFLVRGPYCNVLSADAETASLGKSYLLWFIPALCLQFPLTTLGATLRATGIIKPAVGFQVLSVLLNIVLAPLFIFGIGPWPRMGVMGAALATFISILIADILMLIYFEKKYHYVRFRLALLRPQIKTWGKMLSIGLPPGTEFALAFLYMMIVYAIIRRFGPAAQAGFGIGVRMMQALFLPVVALSFATAPVVGQNFGGRRADRVRQTVYAALAIASVLMLVLAAFSYFAPTLLIRGFSQDANVIAFGGEYLRIVSLNFIAAGLVFTASSIFQGIGNTLPPLLSSLSRLVMFALPAMLLAQQADFHIRYLWYLSVVSQVLQAAINLLLLQRELRKKLVFEEIPLGAVAPG